MHIEKLKQFGEAEQLNDKFVKKLQEQLNAKADQLTNEARADFEIFFTEQGFSIESGDSFNTTAVYGKAKVQLSYDVPFKFIGGAQIFDITEHSTSVDKHRIFLKTAKVQASAESRLKNLDNETWFFHLLKPDGSYEYFKSMSEVLNYIFISN